MPARRGIEMDQLPTAMGGLGDTEAQRGAPGDHPLHDRLMIAISHLQRDGWSADARSRLDFERERSAAFRHLQEDFGLFPDPAEILCGEAVDLEPAAAEVNAGAGTCDIGGFVLAKSLSGQREDFFSGAEADD